MRQIGTNALPTLIKTISAENPFLKQKLVELISKQSFIKIRFTSVDTLHEQAVTAFFILGLTAKPAIPELLELLGHDDTAYQAARALVHVDPEATLSFVKMLTNKSARVRFAAVLTLSDIRNKPEITVPALVRSLADRDPDVQSVAWLGLRLQDSALATPALIECLKDDNAHVRSSVIEILSSYGSRAKAAVPSLLMLLEDSDPGVAGRAAEALRSLDREAAPRFSNPL